MAVANLIVLNMAAIQSEAETRAGARIVLNLLPSLCDKELDLHRNEHDSVDRDQEILDYLQNRLPSEDRDAFEAAMVRDVSLAAEVEVMRSVRAALAAGPQHENATAGWERISAEIDAAPKAANDNRHPWLQVLKYAAVAGIAIATWQATVGPRMAEDPVGFRTASDESTSFSFQVKFVETATLSEIAGVLAPLGGTISDGPTALGLVRLSFADSELGEEARRQLEDRNDLVEFVAD